jgi:cell division protein FtsB
MLFLDNNNIITTMRFKKELETVKEEKVYYETQITYHKAKLHKLQSDKSALADYAREKYLMKKDNEDIFLLIYE